MTHRGPANEIADAWHTFEVALEEHGLESHGVSRQVHLDGDEQDDTWVVELQCPIREIGAACN